MGMILRLLGSTELTGSNGARLDAVLAQPKRFALLAYMAVDRPPRLHRRDSLLLRFWPESDEAHARGALSQALSFLRRSLGDGVIVSRGADEVGLDHALITTDVGQFEAAADAGDHEVALGRYLGDFLSGFHLTGCNEFDDWLTAERQRLRDRAVRSAKAMARAALESGDASRAVVSARHALLLAPHDESAARRMLAALEFAGRPALALQEYEEFKRRLREELGVAPSADLQRYVDALRAKSIP